MKKVFFVLLLLASIFLIGNAEVALAQCIDYHSYECTYTAYQYGEIDEMGTTCVGLCYDSGFEVVGYGGWFSCYLYPIGSKNLLGTANTVYGWAGCSVEFRGRSITAKLSYIQEDEGYIDILRCKPTNVGCY